MKRRETDPLVLVVGAAGAVAVARLYAVPPAPNFTWDELDAPVDPIVRAKLWLLATRVLQPLRDDTGVVHVTSGYRSQARQQELYNQGRTTTLSSDHTRGEAADIYSGAGLDATEIARWYWDHPSVPIDQVIVEHHTGHLHVSMDLGAVLTGAPPTRQFLQLDDALAKSRPLTFA